MCKNIFKLFFLFAIFIIAGACEKNTTPEKKALTPESTPDSNLTSAALREASLAGDFETVAEAIKQNIEPDEPDELGRTALMLASYNGHTEIVRFLLEHNASVNKQNSEGRTSLMFAASGPFTETVELLLKSGADLQLTDSVEGWSALMFASAEGNFDIVKLLLEQGANPSKKDDDGETALDFAENNGHKKTAALLKEYF